MRNLGILAPYRHFRNKTPTFYKSYQMINLQSTALKLDEKKTKVKHLKYPLSCQIR